MQSVPFIVLWLALVPAVFGFSSNDLAANGLTRGEGGWVVRCSTGAATGKCSLEDAAQPIIASNFENCSNLEAMILEPGPKSMFDIFENISQYGSLTGLVDYSPTDTMLRFLDEYVMVALPLSNLHSLIVAILGGEAIELDRPSLFVDEEITEEASL
jgi:hypothetical protein